MFRYSLTRLWRRGVSARYFAEFNKPGPIPLDREEQAEFERLQKVAAETPMANPALRSKHQDFEGDVNPVTGERGGPKQDPLRHGDWSFDGRVTDF